MSALPARNDELRISARKTIEPHIFSAARSQAAVELSDV
jgi:hypothetical protein